MLRKKRLVLLLALAVAVIFFAAIPLLQDGAQGLQEKAGFIYTNDKYGFTFALPETWA